FYRSFVVDGLIREALADTLDDIRAEIAPRNTLATARLITEALDPEVKGDPNFGFAVKLAKDGQIGEACAAFATLAQPDGKIVSVGFVQSNTVADCGSQVADCRTGQCNALHAHSACAITNTNWSKPSESELANDLALARHLPNGTLDPSFGNGGTQTLGRQDSDEVALDGLLLPDGKILVVGLADGSTDRATRDEDRDVLLARFNPDGTPDAVAATRASRSLILAAALTIWRRRSPCSRRQDRGGRRDPG
ncbi:hypothetical protein HC891_25440, partial [Candidatus Gracilibacteria bacterium]|nr:hypothetical protein [Candidatus Gracilibacteria bacterium]